MTQTKDEKRSFFSYFYSPQVHALVNKNLLLQLRQYKTNICQISFPLIMLLFIFILQIITDSILPKQEERLMKPMPTHLMQPIAHALLNPMIQARINSTYNFTSESFLFTIDNPNVNLTAIGELFTNGSGSELLYENSYFKAGGVYGQLPVKSMDGVKLNVNPLQFIELGIPPDPSLFGNGTYRFIPYWTFMESPEKVDNEFYDNILENKMDYIGGFIFEKIQLYDKPEIVYTIQYDNITDRYQNPSGSALLAAAFQTAFCQNLINIFGSCDYVVPSSMLNYINSAFVSKITNGKLRIRTKTQQMPYIVKNVEFNIADAFANFLFPLILSFLLPVFMYTIVMEKSGKLREMMKLMGMKMYNYFIITYITFFVYYVIVCVEFIILCLIFKFRIVSQTSALILFLIFLGWGLNMVSWSFFLSAFIGKTLIAVVMGYLLCIFGSTAGVILKLYVFERGDLNFTPLLLINPFPIAHLFTVISQSCSEFACPGVSDLVNNLEILTGVISLYVNAVLYLLLGLYFDQVLPQPWGIRKSFLFPIEWIWKNKYVQKYIKKEINIDKILKESEEEEDDDVLAERKKVLSGEASKEKNPVFIKNLVKIYGREKLAVNRLCLSLNNDECFGLLGPNGAGKTTTISMLCGLFSPSSGEAYVGTYSIVDEIDKVHLSMGLCPQFDILWDDLTCADHLFFYARLKGIPLNEQKEEVDRILKAVGLEKRRGSYSRNLSGGMKRRLSIGISLVGKPKIVMLDEPTTGLDPTSKRNLWDVILQAKKDKCIILTTHSLEEAEVLCDRIGIMSKGSLKCIGSSLHLKNKFGQGFRLSINFELSNREKATKFVSELLPEAKIHTEFAGNILYEIAREHVVVSKIFKEMEANKAENGIKDWALSQTSLEDVFLNIVRRDEEEN